VVSSDVNFRVVSGFLDYLKVEKGLAPLTVAAYTTDVGQFTGFLVKRKRTLLNARRNEVCDFIQELFSNSVDGRSVGRKLSALRHLYRYLLLDKLIDHDPTLNIDSPKQWKVLPKSLARDEIETLLRSPRSGSTNSHTEAIAVRDQAMLEVFYAGALRVSEMISVKLEDLKLDLGYILVRGKGDELRLQAWAATPARTCCAIAAPHTWSKMERIFARCRRFSAMRIFRPRRYIRTWRLTD
jgi:integrase/recombinase XerD